MARPQPIRRQRIGKPLKEYDPDTTPLRPRFCEYLEAKRRSTTDRTRADYQYGFELYCRWLEATGRSETVSCFGVSDLEAYRDYLDDRAALPGHRGFDRDKLSSFSTHAYLRPLNQFGDYLAWEGWIDTNPFLLTYDSIMPKIEMATRIIKKATPDDIRAILDETAGDDPLALRDRAMVLVDWETGMRAQDLWHLDVADVDLKSGIVSVRNSKGDRDREVRLGDIALPAVARYLGIGRSRQVDAADGRGRGSTPRALFLSDATGSERNSNGRMSSGAIYQMLTRRWQQAGGEGSFGPHRIRHGLATLLVEANVGLALVAIWLGHSLETTTKLYAHPSAHAMHRAIGPIATSSLRDAGYDPEEVA